MMINKKVGNSIEKECLNLLEQHGFWAHLMATKQNGQPVDIVAIKRLKSALIDAKHIHGGSSFPFSYIRSNQYTALERGKRCGVNFLGFAIYNEEVDFWYWLDYDTLIDYTKQGKKSIKFTNLGGFFSNVLDN